MQYQNRYRNLSTWAVLQRRRYFTKVVKAKKTMDKEEFNKKENAVCKNKLCFKKEVNKKSMYALQS